VGVEGGTPQPDEAVILARRTRLVATTLRVAGVCKRDDAAVEGGGA